MFLYSCVPFLFIGTLLKSSKNQKLSSQAIDAPNPATQDLDTADEVESQAVETTKKKRAVKTKVPTNDGDGPTK